MSWHIICIKCDKGCVGDLLLHAICRLKALICPSDIIAVLGGSTETSPRVTLVGNMSPEASAALAQELRGDRKAVKDSFLGAHSWVKRKINTRALFSHQLFTLTAAVTARNFRERAVEVRLRLQHSYL